MGITPNDVDPYNSKHRKLPVFDQTKVNGGLLFKKAVCCYGRKRAGNEVIKRAVSGVFNLCDGSSTRTFSLFAEKLLSSEGIFVYLLMPLRAFKAYLMT